MPELHLDVRPGGAGTAAQCYAALTSSGKSWIVWDWSPKTDAGLSIDNARGALRAVTSAAFNVLAPAMHQLTPTPHLLDRLSPYPPSCHVRKWARESVSRSGELY